MILTLIEEYYDAAPRPLATVEEIGPFTLFVRTDPRGWPYYARPRLHGTEGFTPGDVQGVRARQRELGLPEALEWVDEVTPELLDAVRGAGMNVSLCPLLALPPTEITAHPDVPDGIDVRVLDAGSPALGDTVAAVAAGFAETDHAADGFPDQWPTLIDAGLVTLVGAFAGGAVVGGGSHSPRNGTTELTGIAVIPSARRRGVGAAITSALVRDAVRQGVGTVFLSAGDESVARVYERVGFVRVGTACIAEP